jgi:hypothetical protein
MPSKGNKVLESNSGKKRQRQTTDNLDLMHISCTGLQGVKGCFDLKSSHGEEQPLPPAGSTCKTVITGLKMAKN